MGKKILIIDSNKDRLVLYQQVRQQLAPDAELTTVDSMDSALASLAASSFDTIVLGPIGGDDYDQNETRHCQLAEACKSAECIIYNTKALASYDDLATLFRMLAFSMNNISSMYPRLDKTSR
jgi:hypothetical protein